MITLLLHYYYIIITLLLHYYYIIITLVLLVLHNSCNIFVSGSTSFHVPMH